MSEFKYKFSELSEKAKTVAVHNYWRGLLDERDERPEDAPSIEECFGLCQDCEDDILYDEKGKCEGDE